MDYESNHASITFKYQNLRKLLVTSFKIDVELL